jgi:subtilase family serine protease
MMPTPKLRRWLPAFGAGLILVSGFKLPAQTTARHYLSGHMPEIVSRLQPAGRFPGTNRLHLAIGLPLRNPDALAQLQQQLYDPASPQYRRYLTPEQFAERFGPTEADYQKVIAFARANGLTVTATHGNRLLLDVSGPAANVEQAFHLTLNVYRHPTENRTFFAPAAEPSVAGDLPILDLSGLNNYTRPHPRNRLIRSTSKTAAVAPRTGSGPAGQYFGNDFRTAYAPGTALKGSGQVVGLVEFDGYYPADITHYEAQAGWTNVPLQNVLLDGFNGTPTTDANAVGEVSLDIEMAIAMAPGLAKVVVFEGDPINFVPNDVLNAMAASNSIKQFSCSWGWSGGPDGTTDNIFQQMAAQGQTFLNASGDTDAFTTGVGSMNGVDNPSLANAPSSSPYITQVGGTTLSTASGAGWSSETVWNWGGGTGSSGGISSHYSIPGWQQGINTTTNHVSITQRNIPDVALTADEIYVYYNNGDTATFGGTSCAAPLWAGFIALVNQQAVASGKPVVGFINPAIYALGKGPDYAVCFHDITAGNNTWSGSRTNYYATSGYDLCTGWGTPNGTNLINALANPDSFGVTPETGFTAVGPVGGPFTATTQTFLLTNPGETPFTWVLQGKPSWLDVSSVGGTVNPNNTATVVVDLNSTTYSLVAGTYAATLTFTNQIRGFSQSRRFLLQVAQSVVQNGGFETGDFSGWTLAVNQNVRVDNGSLSGIAPHSGNYLAVLGHSGSRRYLSQTVSTVSNQTYLISLWFYKPAGRRAGEFTVLWNATTFLNRIELMTAGWTNLQFMVRATNASSVLKFGGSLGRARYGLDDVNVWPMPDASIRSVAKTSDHVVRFSWNALPGVTYLVQSSTNLADPHWLTTSTNTATGPVLTCTNACGTDPQRFYRVLVAQ